MPCTYGHFDQSIMEFSINSHWPSANVVVTFFYLFPLILVMFFFDLVQVDTRFFALLDRCLPSLEYSSPSSFRRTLLRTLFVRYRDKW